MHSPIEQEIIDGRYYWDNIAPDWLRLIERSTYDVVGHYRLDSISRTPLYIAVIHTDREYKVKSTRQFSSAVEARTAIEQYAKDHWVSASSQTTKEGTK